MVIDAISTARQMAATPTAQQLDAQADQVQRFQQLFRNSAANDTYSSGLDNPGSLPERFFSRISEMQQNHHDVMTPVQQRVAAESGVDRVIDENAAPFDVHSDRMVRLLPESKEFDIFSNERVDSSKTLQEQTQELMTKHDEKMREILRMQFEVGRAVVQEEFLAGIAGRSTRNLDMLLRGQ